MKEKEIKIKYIPYGKVEQTTRLEIWSKTEINCVNCGKKEVWYAHTYEDENFMCVSCELIFEITVLGSMKHAFTAAVREQYLRALKS